eukprot:1149741-Pelagomonas_calceolata.AAC.7
MKALAPAQTHAGFCARSLADPWDVFERSRPRREHELVLPDGQGYGCPERPGLHVLWGCASPPPAGGCSSRTAVGQLREDSSRAAAVGKHWDSSGCSRMTAEGSRSDCHRSSRCTTTKGVS